MIFFWEHRESRLENKKFRKINKCIFKYNYSLFKLTFIIFPYDRTLQVTIDLIARMIVR